MDFTGLLSRMLVLFFLICVGILLNKLNILDENGCKVINRVVFCVCSPCLVLYSVMNAELTFAISDILLLLLYSLIFNLVALVLGFVSTRFFPGIEKQRGAMRLVISFGNFVFMGFPVISALYGESAIFLVSICSIPFNIFLFAVGGMLVAEKKEGSFPWKRVFTNPSLIATGIAFLVFITGLNMPGPIVDALGYFGNTVIPLSMLLIGASLGRMKLRSIFLSGWKYWVCFVKLIVLPIVIFLVFRPIVKDSLIFGVLVVVAAMPSAAMSPVLCAEYGGDSDFASGSVFLTTLLSLVTVPLVVYLLLL